MIKKWYFIYIFDKQCSYWSLMKNVCDADKMLARIKMIQ